MKRSASSRGMKVSMASEGPPTCLAHGPTFVQTPGTGVAPLYNRWCGPAMARVHVNGASFLIRGGRCVGHPTSFFVRVGLIANPPAHPAKWVGLFIRDPRAAHAGTFRLAETATSFVYATIQLGGPALEIAGGTITIARSMRAGHLHFVSGTRRPGWQLDLRLKCRTAIPHARPAADGSPSPFDTGSRAHPAGVQRLD
jgi:hypothetical protein